MAAGFVHECVTRGRKISACKWVPAVLTHAVHEPLMQGNIKEKVEKNIDLFRKRSLRSWHYKAGSEDHCFAFYLMRMLARASTLPSPDVIFHRWQASCLQALTFLLSNTAIGKTMPRRWLNRCHLRGVVRVLKWWEVSWVELPLWWLPCAVTTQTLCAGPAHTSCRVHCVGSGNSSPLNLWPSLLWLEWSHHISNWRHWFLERHQGEMMGKMSSHQGSFVLWKCFLLWVNQEK